MTRYTAWFEPEGRMLLDAPGDTPEQIAKLAAEKIRRNPPPHLHPEARIEVSALLRRRRGRVILATERIREEPRP